MPAPVVVRKLGYDGAEIFHWTGEILEDDGSTLVIAARFNVGRVDLGYLVLERGDLFYEFYYRDRWFNVFQIYRADGHFKGWYCNLSTPALLEGGELRYADLELDLFVRPDFTWLEDDRPEYEAKKAGLYRREDVQAAEAGYAELLSWAERRALPSRPFVP